jgi:TM2 domain-containing membrane protein YozV
MSGPYDPYQQYPRELPPTPPYPTSASPYDVGQPEYQLYPPPAPVYQNLPAPYSPPVYQNVPAPYAVDPLTGQPYSDKSKIVAGLLQLLPGFLLGLGGIGRLYAGNVGLGIAQLVATVVGWVSFWCGFIFIVPFFIYAAAWLWFVIDGIIMMAGQPVDGQGRPLRS